MPEPTIEPPFDSANERMRASYNAETRRTRRTRPPRPVDPPFISDGPCGEDGGCAAMPGCRCTFTDGPPFDCPGGVGINVDTVYHLAQCPGPCGTWFTTTIDDPVFPPHRVSGTTIDWGFRRG